MSNVDDKLKNLQMLYLTFGHLAEYNKTKNSHHYYHYYDSSNDNNIIDFFVKYYNAYNLEIGIINPTNGHMYNILTIIFRGPDAIYINNKHFKTSTIISNVSQYALFKKTHIFFLKYYNCNLILKKIKKILYDVT